MIPLTHVPEGREFIDVDLSTTLFEQEDDPFSSEACVKYTLTSRNDGVGPLIASAFTGNPLPPFRSSEVSICYFAIFDRREITTQLEVVLNCISGKTFETRNDYWLRGGSSLSDLELQRFRDYVALGPFSWTRHHGWRTDKSNSELDQQEMLAKSVVQFMIASAKMKYGETIFKKGEELHALAGVKGYKFRPF